MPVDPYLGEVSIFAGNFAPRGWAFCDGQLLPISQYSALFSLLGTIYGGDGRTTFALPDMRGRMAMGHGNGPGLSNRNFGARGGQETTTLSIVNMPNHNHVATLHAEAAPGTSGNPTGQLLSIVNTGETEIYAAPVPATNIAMASEAITVSSNGGGQSFSNEPPFIVMGYIIALQGTFPSRS